MDKVQLRAKIWMRVVGKHSNELVGNANRSYSMLSRSTRRSLRQNLLAIDKRANRK